MSTTAQYASTPKIGTTLLTTANTALDGSGTLGTVFSTGAAGSRIEQIDVQGTATTTAAEVNLFIYNGTTAFLWKQIPLTAVTSSTTTPAFTYTISSQTAKDILPLVLPIGYSLKAAVSVTQTGVNVIAVGGDF